MSAGFDLWASSVDQLLAKEGFGVTHLAFDQADLDAAYGSGLSPMTFVMNVRSGSISYRDPGRNPAFLAWAEEVGRIRPYMRPDMGVSPIGEQDMVRAFLAGNSPSQFLQAIPSLGPTVPQPEFQRPSVGPFLPTAVEPEFRDSLVMGVWIAVVVRFCIGMGYMSNPNPGVFAFLLFLDLALIAATIVLLVSKNRRERTHGQVLLGLWVLGCCFGAWVGFVAASGA